MFIGKSHLTQKEKSIFGKRYEATLTFIIRVANITLEASFMEIVPKYQ